MSEEGEIQVGTSGWTYNDWRGTFYPKGLHQSDQLSYYADHFQSAEMNKTFNQFPFAGYINKCNNRVSDDFVFSVCGNRRITHESGLRDLRGVMNAFFNRLDGLDKLSVVVWEIPEDIEKDTDMLMEFLEVLPMQFRHGIEFGHESWEDDEEVKEMLQERGVSSVVTHRTGDDPVELANGGSFSYVRFRDGEEENGADSVDEDVLSHYADQARELRQEGRDVYIYFLNTDGASAVEDARELEELLT